MQGITQIKCKTTRSKFCLDFVGSRGLAVQLYTARIFALAEEDDFDGEIVPEKC